MSTATVVGSRGCCLRIGRRQLVNDAARLHQTRRMHSETLEGIPAAKQRHVPTSGTYPRGFLVSATHVGIKPSNKDKPDLAIIRSTQPCAAAAIFTQNRFAAAPVTVSQRILKEATYGSIRNVIINSGKANAVTGSDGVACAESMVHAVNEEAHNAGDVGSATLVMSTGVIGQPLPTERIVQAVPGAYKTGSNSHNSWFKTACSIMTTDTFPKLLSTEFTLPSTGDSTKYRMAGITKGAGMIHPNMATLLGLVCTDAPIHQEPLQKMLRNAANYSFNNITIDGDTSTNDTLAILANGAAGGEAVASMDELDWKAMNGILKDFLLKLSHLVVRDGEGATKFVHIRVIHANHSISARRIAKAIATSPLVKTALNGEDANWGRILCAIGNVPDLPPLTIIPEKTSVSFVPKKGSSDSTILKLLDNGEPTKFDEARAKEILKEEDLEILVDLGEGGGRNYKLSYYTCDFSHEYVSINADYRT